MPDSKLNKKIKNAQLHLKRAEERGLDASTIADRKEELDALLTKKALNKAEHDA